MMLLKLQAGHVILSSSKDEERLALCYLPLKSKPANLIYY